MDPNANLREQRELVDEINDIQDEVGDDGVLTADQKEDLARAVFRLAELVEALDNWIRRGGFLPDTWQRSNDAPRR